MSESLQAENKALRQRVETLEHEVEKLRAALAKVRRELAKKDQELFENRILCEAAERMKRAVEEREARLRRSLDAAKEIQRRLLPTYLPMPDGVDFTVEYLPTDEPGGDLYDIFELGDGKVGLLIADVAGHGIPAAIATTMAKVAFQTFSHGQSSPKVILERINGSLYDVILEGQFLTAFLAILDTFNMTLTYANASHFPPLFYDGKEVSFLDTGGFFVGMFEEPEYEEKTIEMKDGARLLMYSDGLVNARIADGRVYGRERLRKLFETHAAESIDEISHAILEDFRREVGQVPLKDDVTLVGAEIQISGQTTFEMVIPSDPHEIGRVEENILRPLKLRGWGERDLFGVRLAVDEALTNAIRHGNKNDRSKKVKIRYKADREGMELEIEDEGPGFHVTEVPDPRDPENLERSHGRGIFLIRHYMDTVEYLGRGNIVRMTKKSPWL